MEDASDGGKADLRCKSRDMHTLDENVITLANAVF
jgi:hypothetical protein